MADQDVAPVVPQAPQTNDEKIGEYARGFLQSLETNQDPDDPDGNAQVPVEQETGEAPPQEATDEPVAEEATPAQTETPMVEVELDDGTKVQVPENIKPHLMRDKDYRQKTMALAEQRKGYESLMQQAQASAAQAQQMAPYHAQLYAMENRANQLGQALQSNELAQDPIEFNRVQGELAILLRNKDQLSAGLYQQMSQINQQQAEMRSQRLALEVPKLFEEIPDLAKPEVRDSLGKFVRDMGVSEEEFAYATFSVPFSKIAYKAQQYDKIVKQQGEARAKLAEKVKAAPGVAQTGRSSNTGGQDKQLRNDWRKGGGKLNDPAFDQLLRNKLRGK